MKLQNNVTIFTGGTQSSAQADKGRESRPSSGKNSTFYAGNLLKEFPLKDRIQQKKAQAQARAMKIVGDALDSDRKIDRLIEESREHIGNLQDTYRAAQDRMVEIREESEALKEVYQVDPDSEEQRYLDLRLKEQATQWLIPEGELTEEESRLLYEYELQGKDKELTEYQERQLKLNEELGQQKLVAYIAEYGSKDSVGIQQENAVIRGINEERRKVHPVVDAQKQVEEVMEAARDEIIGVVVEEARDHIDGEQEKKEEEAEAIKEKKEEQEKILEKRDEREEALEKLLEDMPVKEMTDLQQTMDAVKQQIQKVLFEVNLTAEDVKGAKVDSAV